MILTSERVLLDGALTAASILLDGDRIIEVAHGHDAIEHHGAKHIDVRDAIVTPGLIDLHIHGAAGHSFEGAVGSSSHPGAPHEGPAPAILRHLASVGVTSVQASLASDRVSSMVRRSRALRDLRHHSIPGAANLLGVHLEGPFLAPSQSGAHDPGNLRSPSSEDVASLAATVPTMVTLAPELPGAGEAVAAFKAAGTVVAAGHSEAIKADLADATAKGLSHVTHLWSGQSSTTRSGPWRVPGLLEEALASSDLTAEVIADGKHLPPALLEIARRCFGERLIVVSDATPGAGMPEGFRYPLASVKCEVRRGVGMVLNMNSFGGSTTTLPAMLSYLYREMGWPLSEVLAMSTSRPAQIAGLGHRKGSIAPGYDADIAVFNDEFEAQTVIVRGQQIPCSLG